MGQTREFDAQFQVLVIPNKSSGYWPIGFMRGSRVACRISSLPGVKQICISVDKMDHDTAAYNLPAMT